VAFDFPKRHTELWMLLDTKPFSAADGPLQRRAEYAVRTDIEEGHRQLKCFWDLAHFTARAFSLVLNQVVFVLLAYNLLQVFLRSQAKPPLSRRTRPRARDLLVPTANVVIIYADNRFATFSPIEYTRFLLTLEEAPRLKILSRLQCLGAEPGLELRLARPP
jgi:hypothetical protein